MAKMEPGKGPSHRSGTLPDSALKIYDVKKYNDIDIDTYQSP